MSLKEIFKISDAGFGEMENVAFISVFSFILSIVQSEIVTFCGDEVVEYKELISRATVFCFIGSAIASTNTKKVSGCE
ncbi:MAG: hypothetical protein NTV87_06240 [Ignavibacteriae bacterium]|nr:hypothetical protein [Ignavibacteriota bacterium]